MIGRWFHRLDDLGARAKALALAALFVVIVAADAVTGQDLTLRALYLLPVGAAAWLLGIRAGFVVALLSVGVSSYFDVVLGLERTHSPFVYVDAGVRLVVYLAAAAILVRLREVQTRLGELAETDPLTGLYNRRGFGRIAEREIGRARRTRSSLTVVHFDLDGFKAVNDTLGHAEGDDVLVAVGHTLRFSRALDVAARLGGDEFALLLPDTASERATSVVARLVGGLNEAMSARGWRVTFSVGVATFREAPRSLDEMLAVADALMYEVKRHGKGSVQYRTVRAGSESLPTVGDD